MIPFPLPSLWDLALLAFVFVGLPFGSVGFLSAWLIWG
jgi:hypothetical protein